MEITIRQEIKQEPIYLKKTAEVATDKLKMNEDNTVSFIKEVIEYETIAGWKDGETYNVIGVYDEERGARETYYEREYSDFVKDLADAGIGEDVAADYATKAEWSIKK